MESVTDVILRIIMKVKEAKSSASFLFFAQQYRVGTYFRKGFHTHLEDIRQRIFTKSQESGNV